MFKQHDRILRGAAAGVVLFALAGSMSAVIAAPRGDAPALTMATEEAAPLPPFEPTDTTVVPGAEPVHSEAQATAEEILSEIGGGLASWYGSELAGRRTASGERFDPADYTAAHRSLPFGSKVRVTAVKSGRSVIVRINDRGPFTHSRVIDVSQAAARDLGLVASGSGNVRLQLIAS